MTAIRESLEAAAEAVESASATEAPPEAAAAPVEVAEVAAPAEKAPPDEAAKARARDEGGRFAKAEAAREAKKAKEAPPEVAANPVDAKAAAAAAPPAEAKPETPPAEKESAPAGWKPLEREAFFKAPPEVRQAILRREKEIASAMQESAPAKRLAQEFQQVLAPHAQHLQAQGIHPVQHVGQLLQASAILTSGAPAAKAQFVAQLIRNSGVPIELLAQHLDGQPQPQQGQPQQMDPSAIAQQVRQQLMQELQQQRQQHGTQRATQEIQSFSQGKEFFDEVREDMALILESAARRGVTVSIEDAYTRASQLHPEVSKVLKQREDAAAAKATLASAQRSRAASTSVRPQPAGVSAPQPKGIREALAMAASKIGG